MSTFKFKPRKMVGYVTNNHRADCGGKALNRMTPQDLIANILHFCDREDIDVNRVIRLAKLHWRAER